MNMRYVRDQTGRFTERPHYEPKELDVIFERIIVDFLKAQHGKVQFPITTDDLTVLIERDTEDLDPYADLSVYGDGVEGVTEFMPSRKPRVRIAVGLATSENHENRYRTTLTHEYGHVRLHSYLFALGSSDPGLFDRQRKPDVIACKRDTMVTTARTDWLEWQAGYACGAALMPATHARMVADAYRKKVNLYGPVPAISTHGLALINGLVETFQVSRDAARVRLSILGFLGAPPAAGSLFG
jgi:hypothetical protein